MAVASPADRALQRSYRILALRARSEKELRVKLRERGFEKNTIDSVIVRLKELGYINDEAFAGQWARHLAVNNLWGDRRIELSLREKGIGRDLTKTAIDAARQEISEIQAIRKLVLKKLKAGESQELDDLNKNRILRNLSAKGFPPGLIYRIINGLQEDSLDDDGK